MYGYIYKTTNLVDNLIYIGQKKSNHFLGNGYLGSGKLIKKAIKKYGRNNFKVELLEEIFTPEDMDAREIYWISYYNSTDHTIGYNISEGGFVNRTMVGENNPFYGRKHSPESIVKMSLSKKGTPAWNKGLTKNTDPRVMKYASQLFQKPSHASGTIWLHNNNEEKMVHINEVDQFLVLGWQKGRLPSSVHHNPTHMIGRRRMNNGLEERSVKPENCESYLQKGWVYGRLPFYQKNKNTHS